MEIHRRIRALQYPNVLQWQVGKKWWFFGPGFYTWLRIVAYRIMTLVIVTDPYLTLPSPTIIPTPTRIRLWSNNKVLGFNHVIQEVFSVGHAFKQETKSFSGAILSSLPHDDWFSIMNCRSFDHRALLAPMSRTPSSMLSTFHTTIHYHIKLKNR